MLVLGIESSCDDSSIAVLKDGKEILSLVKKSQVELHQDFGGVVPEIAARGHLEAMFPVLEKALDLANVDLNQIDLITATAGPGLIGSLLVGLNMGKVLALKTNKPFVAVHHLEAHFAANALEREFSYPAIGLLVSGGHSCLYLIPAQGEYEILGETRDDAVGELYDKVARKMGLDQPGGPKIDKMAHTDGDIHSFTAPMLHSKDLDFSFSGLKTACLKALDEKVPIDQIARGMQEAVIEVLWKKTHKALKEHQVKNLILAGGVSANQGIRSHFSRECERRGIAFSVPRLALCTDNGAMVARAGWERYQSGFQSQLDVDAFSRLSLAELEGGDLWQKS